MKEKNITQYQLLKAGIDNKTLDSIKKGGKIFVVVKDTKNQKVAIYNQNAKKTGAKVTMGSTYTAKAVKKVDSKKIVKINKSQWLNSKDVVKN